MQVDDLYPLVALRIGDVVPFLSAFRQLLRHGLGYSDFITQDVQPMETLYAMKIQQW